MTETLLYICHSNLVKRNKDVHEGNYREHKDLVTYFNINPDNEGMVRGRK